MTINERFEAIIRSLFNGNKRAFAKAVGISPTVVENIVGTRKGKPSYDVLKKVCANANISAEWLLFGSNEDLISDVFNVRKNLAWSATPGDDPENEEKAITTVFTKSKENYVPPTAPMDAVHEPNVITSSGRDEVNSNEGIPLIPISAMAGIFTGDTSVMEYECERYVIPDFKGADFLIRVKGDSMQPTYYSGDLVACQRVPLDALFFQWNKTYVLDTVQGPLIKRVKRGSDDNHVLIVSDNTDYEPFELSKDQFHGVALVRGLVRLE